MMICRIRSHAVAIFISCGVLATSAWAQKDTPAPVAKTSKAAKGDAAARAAELIAELQGASTEAARKEASEKLIALRPAPIAYYKEFLERERSSSDGERRSVLGQTSAEVPDEKGKFAVPQRETKKSEREKDAYDWFADLVGLRPQAGLGDVLSDVAVIRALAASEKSEGGSVLVEFAFSDAGLIYRDECGRYLRNMAPYSLPALIRGSQNRKSGSMMRYTGYQLERLDRQNPQKAFDAAATENLQIDILNAFADSQYREAVYAVLDQVNHVAPRVRKVARAAWMEFVDGRAPPKPPERKLELPNGKLSQEKSPLWLDHRVLARTAILERLQLLTGEKQNANASLVALTEKLFSFYDEQRVQAQFADFEKAKALEAAGNTAEATVIFDRILAEDPEFSKRAEMVPAYLKQADALAKADNWSEAAVAYGKVSAMAPESEQAQAALKQHHLARVKVAESKGVDASAEKAIAGEITATATSTKTATKSKLILFAGLAGVAGAIVLLALGLMLRRRPTRAHS